MKDIWNRIHNLPIQTHRNISLCSAMGGSVIGWICAQIGDGLGFAMVLCFIMIIAGFAWHIVFVKCPHCGHHFGFRQHISTFCPECGKKLALPPENTYEQ